VSGVPGITGSEPERAHPQLRAFVAALTFLTRIPVAGVVAHDANDLPAASVYFPVVGLIVGTVGAVVVATAAALWPPTLAIILSVAVTVWITGAFHEDALADSFDGFGGGWDKAQVLTIMKDSRVGSYALVGVLLVIATKIAALRAIFDGVSTGGAIEVGRALVAGHVLGRWSSVILIATHEYVRPAAPNERPSAGKPFVGAVTTPRLIAATTIALLVVAMALGRSAFAVIGIAAGVMWIAGRYFQRRIGGITGDALGAANQFVELAVYLTLAARW
jgi:adenosylcobinamide-GDP ribazoletransferase